MERVLAEAIGAVTTVAAEVPEPKAGWARLRLTFAGICGSDTHAVAGNHPNMAPPYFPGHEAVGVVEAVGADADSALLGRRVILKPNLPCGDCVNCRGGRSNACQTLAWIGCDPSGLLPGAMAEFFVAPVANLYAVPDAASDRQAALVECLATPMHAARMAGALTGARVLVQGGGTIGALQVIAAKLAGAGVVVVSDLDAGKRKRALRLGAAAAVAADSPKFAEEALAALGGMADVVFDCVAAEASARQWPGLVRRGATLCVVGVPARDYALPMTYVQDWELRVQGCASYDETDFEAAVALAAQIPADEIIAGEFPLREAAEAFRIAATNSSGKVLLHS